MPSPDSTSKLLRIDSLYGKHAGETLVILGTSPSLDELDLTQLAPLTKIGINRVIRRLPVDYLSMSECSAFHAVEQLIRAQQPVLLLYWHLAGTLGQELNGLTYCAVRLEKRDGEKLNRLGRREGLEWEEVPPGHPYYRFYPNTFPNKKESRRRIAKPGKIQRDGLFLHSCSNAMYAIEWAYRMLSDINHTPGRIVLAGIDFRKAPSGPNKGLTYIREVNTMLVADRSCSLPPPDLFIPQLGRAREILAADNIELVSASPWEGPLDEMIPRRPLQEILA